MHARSACGPAVPRGATPAKIFSRQNNFPPKPARATFYIIGGQFPAKKPLSPAKTNTPLSSRVFDFRRTADHDIISAAAAAQATPPLLALI